MAGRRWGQTFRLYSLAVLIFGSLFLLGYRLYDYQVVQHDRFKSLASEEHRQKVPIVPRRGAILDAGGNPIAVSVMYESVYAVGSEVLDRQKTAASLAPVLEIPEADVYARLDPASKVPVLLKPRVPAALSSRIGALGLRGIYLEPVPFRQYPEGSMAAQTIGFVGHDFHGLAGLELSYDEELAGQNGVIETERDTGGNEIVMARRSVVPARDGADLVLNIDRFVQRSVERILADAVKKNKATGGIIMVMEPRTGGILAMAAVPTYSLTDENIYKPEFADLYRSVHATDIYEPGSVMKVITMAAALEEGLVSPNTVVNDPGFVRVGGSTIRNWDGAANGVITMTQVLVKSSNVGAQWVAGLLGPERFYRYLDAFGFGRRTGVNLPGESAGMVRRPGSDNWTRVDLATNSFGQGIAVTPIQMLTAVAAIANDGVLMKPRLVRELRTADGTRIVQPEVVGQPVSAGTARTLRDMMIEVLEQPALREYRLPGYRLAGKTGTADFPSTLGYTTGRTYASVVAFGPVEDPRFAILVRIDSPEGIYGGRVAVPVLWNVAKELFNHYRIPAARSDSTKGAGVRT